ncbi:MAG TPA: S24/S26 family peptidase [Candidatus Methanoperedens sp.]|nr:S24/S26 family peptidase [Candidatus Methanoperedens sp.]
MGGDSARRGLPALAAALLREGRAVRLVARGGSMAPFIRDGETVLLAPLRSTPRPGEVVLSHQSGGRLALHRVVRVTGSGFVTRGDATATDDALVAPADIVGRAVAISGRPRLHLRSAFGRLVLRGLGVRGRLLEAGPLRPLARAARALAARIP